MRLRLSRRAQDDLADIAAYLFVRNPRAADNVQQHLTMTLETIAAYPSRAAPSQAAAVAWRSDVFPILSYIAWTSWPGW